MRSAAALALLALAACASNERPRGSADVTLFGPEPRLESWKTAVLDGAHVHPADPDLPCASPSLAAVAATASDAMAAKDERLREPAKQLGSRMGDFMEALIARSQGPARGGPDRTVLALMHLREDGKTIDRTLLVDLPRLPPGERERLVRTPELRAWLERPPLTPEAELERGWVRASRLESGAVDYELFLVLRPSAPGARDESLQVVTRLGSVAR